MFNQVESFTSHIVQIKPEGLVGGTLAGSVVFTSHIVQIKLERVY